MQTNLKPIGVYTFRATGGPEPTLYGEKKVFGVRWVGLVAIKRDVTQVLVWSLGVLAWINPEQGSVKLHNGVSY